MTGGPTGWGRNSYPDGWVPVLVHHFLLQHAATFPGHPAIEGRDLTFSYQELGQRARTYAEALAERGLAPGDIVIVKLEPCPQAVALLAALSTLGAVYAPVNTDLPVERLVQIIDTTEAKAYVDERAEAPANDGLGVPVHARLEGPDLVLDGGVADCDRAPRGPVLESDVAYMIFTSGTTGRPKGIMISHRAALVFWRALVHHCELGSAERVGTFAPLGFDFSLIDIGAALGSGATLVQVPRMLIHQPPRFVRFLAERRITQMDCVPSVWRLLVHHAPGELAALSELHTAFVAGEAFPVADVRRLRAALPELRIVNCFGHTESMCSTFQDVPIPIPDDMENLAIGFAHPGAELLLLDEKRVPIEEPGVTGELYLRGANLFSGYFKNPEETERALVPHPLRPHLGERVFRTGDMANRGERGELYYSGRRDLQVQIMGMRTEVEEIERRLVTHPAIVEAGVILVEDGSSPLLVAFFVAELDAELDPVGVRRFCSDALPPYMVPCEVRRLDRLPTSANGKLDRHDLRRQWERAKEQVAEVAR